MSTIWFTFIVVVHIAIVVCSEENEDHQNIDKLQTQEIDNRIFKGKATRIKTVPYQVYIATDFVDTDQKFKILRCGGAILRPKIIITAAHCVHNKDIRNIHVRAGSSFFNNEGVTRTVSQVIIHELFKQDLLPMQPIETSYIRSIDYDVALLKLSESLEYSEKIKNVKIPKQNDRLVPGKFGTIAGWGFFLDTRSSTVLQKTNLPVISNQKCTGMSSIILTPRMFCAGYFKKDTSNICKGDSGSPFVANNKIYGIASALFTLCNGNPSITYLTDILYVRNWVISKLNALS